MISLAKARLIINTFAAANEFMLESIKARDAHIPYDLMTIAQLDRVKNVHNKDINNEILNDVNMLMLSIQYDRWCEVGFRFGKLTHDMASTLQAPQ